MRPTREERLLETQKRIRHTYRLEILLPFILGVVGLVALTLIAAFVPRTSLTANLLMTILLICPMVILTFVFVLAAVASIYGMAQLNKLVHKPMQRAEELTIIVRDKVVDSSEMINQQTINLSTKTAPFEMWLNNAFVRKKKKREELP